MQLFQINIIREAGSCPYTGNHLEYSEEVISIAAETKQEAFQKSQFASTLPFRGQLRRTIIDGEEYFDDRL